VLGLLERSWQEGRRVLGPVISYHGLQYATDLISDFYAHDVLPLGRSDVQS
jgi:hypothetical protein